MLQYECMHALQVLAIYAYDHSSSKGYYPGHDKLREMKDSNK
jgi:hypothetical protein